ncbi:MAG: asparagine synthase (glutamine-hydrolyzing) [bacterium]
MCGFVGIYNYGNSQEIDEKLLIEMRDTMIHRGPDDCGIYLSRDRKLGLGHRRLSIIDLSPRGRQPMSDIEGKIWIVYNGEVYNFPELREGLENKYTFRSRTDTEVLIYLYKEYDKDMVHKLRGMFAFAIWDDTKKELWLVRDRIGIKPLYYTFVDGRFIFASEIKAILKHPFVKREVNEEGLYHYLSFLTTPPPQTLFQGIDKIPAGHMLTLNKNGNYKVEQYWDVFDNVKPLYNKDESYYTERLLELFRESVKLRMISDVPIGVFLSGGIDSSTNTALFSEFANDVKTFSIGFKGQEKFNEFQYAKKVANIFKTKHHELIIDVEDLINFLDQLVYHQDEPIADPVCVPVYYVAKLAKDNGVTVCQVGEGADELFCGYPIWGIMLKLNQLSRYWRFAPSLIRTLGLKAIESVGKGQSRYYELLRRAHNKESVFWGGADAFNIQQKKSFLSPRLRNKFKNSSSYEIVEKYYERFLAKSLIHDYLNFMTYLDISFRLPELLLMRVDKMAMAVSLEARVPFLDHKLVEFAMSIPQSVKVRNGELKHIMKKTVERVIPHEIIYRKKQGFGVPVKEWFFLELGNFTEEKLVKFSNHTDFFHKPAIEKMFIKRRGEELWFLLNFVMWYEKWVEKI